MHTTTHRALAVLVFATALLAAGAAAAHGRGRGFVGVGVYPGHYAGGHGYWGPRYRGGVSIGIGLGSGYYYGAPWPGYYAYPGYGVAPPLAYPHYEQPPQPPAQPLAKGPPDPIFYPRSGQGPEETEADRRACDRWALTQRDAAARADVFHRATLACMEGRGYAVR